jgi:YHS domain-containing protein
VICKTADNFIFSTLAIYNMKDPVCDMDVNEQSVATEYKGKRYHFCCDMCKASFEKNPKQFVKE